MFVTSVLLFAIFGHERRRHDWYRFSLLFSYITSFFNSTQHSVMKWESLCCRWINEINEMCTNIHIFYRWSKSIQQSSRMLLTTETTKHEAFFFFLHICKIHEFPLEVISIRRHKKRAIHHWYQFSIWSVYYLLSLLKSGRLVFSPRFRWHFSQQGSIEFSLELIGFFCVSHCGLGLAVIIMVLNVCVICQRNHFPPMRYFYLYIRNIKIFRRCWKTIHIWRSIKTHADMLFLILLLNLMKPSIANL